MLGHTNLVLQNHVETVLSDLTALCLDHFAQLPNLCYNSVIHKIPLDGLEGQRALQ